uniref:Ribonuclease H-like domain-containing protein n=1 Tax=Tanacetum cinerariifolium TaxID=118510 RepID=A0A699H748_TANCI|nr:ribonuclease H-like domain-containing protein [Tanacetum cinerariifolium]
MKFLRSLPAEWNTHVVVWKNKPDLETISFDDLYNNFKIVEQEVKRTVVSSSSSRSPNMAFLSSSSSTNEVDTASIQVSDASTPVSTVSSPNNTANLSDAIVYAFFANQPNGYQLVHEDLEQIHEDDLEEMNLKRQLALLSMRARRYFQKTGKKITINGSDTAGYDKTKVECFNCHKMRHFARECRSPRNQESRPRNQDISRKTVIVEDISFKAMVAIDGAGFDWSYLGDDEVPTNMALMAFSDSEKEKDSNQIKIDNFENASKSLDKLIESKITDNSKTGLGFTSYNAVAPPPTCLFAPPTTDLSSSGLKGFKQPEFESYGPKASKSVCVDTSNVITKVFDALIIEDWVSNLDEDESEEVVIKSKNVQNKSEQVNQPRKENQNPRNNRTNWNQMRTQKLGVGFQFSKKACFVCRSFSHLIEDCGVHDKKMVLKLVLKTMEKKTGQREVRPVWNHAMRVNHQNFSKSRRNFAPTAVLTKSGIVPISTARQSSSRLAAPVSSARPINTTAPKPIDPMLLSPQHAGFGDLKLRFKIMSPKTVDHTFVRDLTMLIQKADSRNKSFLSDYPEYDGGFIAFAGSSKGGKITGKGKIRTGKLDFEDVYFVKELKFNFLSVSQMVLVTKPHNKTPYELLTGRAPIISFMRPFGCPVTILNTLDHLGKFDGSGPEWLFDIDSLKNSMNYQPISAGNKTNGIAGLRIHSDAGQEGKEKVSNQEYILLPVLNTISDVPSSNEEVESSPKDDAGKNTNTASQMLILLVIKMKLFKELMVNGTFQHQFQLMLSVPLLVALDDFSKMLNLKDTGIFDDAYDDRDEGAEADYNNLETMEPKKATHALDDESWVEAVQEELLYFKLLNVWTLVDLPHGKRATGTKWVYRNKRDQRGIAIRNKARLTKVHVDIESVICVVKNLVYHSKTKHIEMRHHFIIDSYEKRLIEMFVDQHNMVAYLEKSDDNTEFHQIVDFLSSCSITYALTAIVDGKAVVISESLVRSDLLFDDEDGITCLTNDEIFENLALMGYEPLSTKLTFQKDEAVNQEEGDRVERAITTDASLEAAQDIDNITKTQTTTMPNVDIP